MSAPLYPSTSTAATKIGASGRIASYFSRSACENVLVIDYVRGSGVIMNRVAEQSGQVQKSKLGPTS